MSGPDQPAAEMQGSDVFLSYSRDDQATARKVLELLEEAGISVWWDAKLEGGARFQNVTEFNLENAAAVVVLWSKVSVQSHWVHDEATRGRDRGCLIPVSIDGTLPPLGFRQFQWIDVSQSAWSLDHPEIAKLVHAVEARRDGVSSKVGSFDPATAQPLTQPRGGLSRRGAIIGGGIGALAIGAGGIVAWNAGLIGGGETSKRLAVMPFEVVGNPGEQGYLVENFSVQIRSQLARNSLLHVAARASSNAFREVEATAGEICDKLKVDFLLNGDIRIENGRLVGSAELAEGADERLVRAFPIDHPVESVLAIQSQIAAEITSELAAEERAASANDLGGTDNIAAYDAFLRGKELYDAGTSEATDRAALGLFEEAIRLDPNYAAAYAMLSRALAIIGNLYAGADDRDSIFGRAVEAAESAVTIAPQFADGHAVLAFVRARRQLDMSAAAEPYEKARELGSGDSDIMSRYAVFRARMGDFPSARDAINTAKGLDPLNSRVFRFAGNIDYYSGNLAAAIEHFDTGRSIQSSMSSYHHLVGQARLVDGDLEAAKESFEQEDFFVWKKTGLAIVEEKLGNRSAAEEHLSELMEKQGDKSNYQYMQVHAQWGEPEAALEAMEAAYTARDTGLVELYVDPLLDPIRGTQAFRAMLKRMGYE